MDLDWCIRCDKRTKGGLYCSEACQREDYASNVRACMTPDPINVSNRSNVITNNRGAHIIHGLATPSASPEHFAQLPLFPRGATPHGLMRSSTATATATAMPASRTLQQTRSALAPIGLHPQPAHIPLQKRTVSQPHSLFCGKNGMVSKPADPSVLVQDGLNIMMFDEMTPMSTAHQAQTNGATDALAPHDQPPKMPSLIRKISALGVSQSGHMPSL
jgi:hypothetical protein